MNPIAIVLLSLLADYLLGIGLTVYFAYKYRNSYLFPLILATFVSLILFAGPPENGGLLTVYK
jgi:hypothetical protein